jgi:hypothetical protein
MDERHGTIRLADPGESEARGLVITVPRAQVEEALHSEEPVDLWLDIERSVEGEGRETQRLALAWERQDLEQLLENDGSEITLTFDEAELQRLLDEDVEAHGMREKAAVLTVVVGIAAAGASSAIAMPMSDGSGASGPATPAATAQAPSSEISTGLGQQTAATSQTGRTGPSEISTGLTGAAPAPASEISTGIVGETPAPSSEISTGVVQQPTATPVSADSPSWSPSPSEGAAIAVGALLAITAAGFAVRSRRTGGPTAAT